MTSLATLLNLATEGDARKAAAVSLGDSVKSDGVSKSTAAFGELFATIMSDDKKQAKAREGVMSHVLTLITLKNSPPPRHPQHTHPPDCGI